MTKGAEYARRWRQRHPDRKRQSDFNQRRRRGNQILSEYQDALLLRVKKQMLGKTFGKLRVVAFGGKDKNGKHRWLCLCNCGRFTVKPCSQKLKNSHTRSCGCLLVKWAKQMGRRPRPPKRQGQELRDFWNRRNAVRRKTNRIEILIRHRIWEALRSQRQKKSRKLVELLGTDIPGFKTHLESSFRNGMTWENYGRKGWHVDHIIPCASFNLSSIEDQKRCFHFSNCQPLWASENIKKRDRMP